MNRVWLMLCFVWLSLPGRAQSQFFFNHYMLNPSFFNPAWVGTESIASATFQYRSQWTGYNTTFDGAGGAPSTQLLSVVLPVVDFPISGLGLNVSNDNLGPLANQQIQISTSYALTMRKGTLRVGIMPGLYGRTLKFDQLRFNDVTDPYNIQQRETQLKPDFSAGLFYQSNNKFLVGLSGLNLLESNFDFGLADSLGNQIKRSYYLFLARPISFSPEISILPNVMIRSNFSGFTFDLGAMIFLNEKIWGGISYRLEESIILYFGYSMLKDNALKLGYSFDYVIQNQDAKQVTSNEIFLKYDLPNLIFGGKKSVKTPRFAF